MTCKTCPLNKDCAFDLRQRGGFKGEGPKYIGYRLITDSAEQTGSKEDTATCFGFIDSGLQKRMTTGRNLRDDGKDGELVKIIAQEEAGPDHWKTVIKQAVIVGFSLRGEIVKPQTHLIEYLEKAGYKVSREAAVQAIDFKEVEYEIPVPKFVKEQAKIQGYKQSVMARELAEQNQEEDADDKAWEEAQARKKTAQPEAKAEPVRKSA